LPLAYCWFARNEQNRPATDIISQSELDCLRLIEKRQRRPLPNQPTVGDVLFAIACMVGLLKQNKSTGGSPLAVALRGFKPCLVCSSS
jgi:hypothetical protein